VFVFQCSERLSDCSAGDSFPATIARFSIGEDGVVAARFRFPSQDCYMAYNVRNPSKPPRKVCKPWRASSTIVYACESGPRRACVGKRVRLKR
jgi:hypothetical protein